MVKNIIKSIGNERLYKMGFSGCCIGTLRKLTPEQVKELVEELEKIHMEIQQQQAKIIK